MRISDKSIAVIGLGYAGLPLAIELSKKFNVLGFDINEERIKELEVGYDRTREITKQDIKAKNKLTFSSIPDILQRINIYLITVPTPIDKKNEPDLSPLKKASETNW